MESVCKEFNCPEMLPALNAGFKAFCEASDIAPEITSGNPVADELTGMGFREINEPNDHAWLFSDDGISVTVRDNDIDNYSIIMSDDNSDGWGMHSSGSASDLTGEQVIDRAKMFIGHAQATHANFNAQPGRMVSAGEPGYASYAQ